jgi:hypothetical protein
MSRGQLLYLVYENELFDFKIEYPQGVWPCCDEGYSPAYSTNGITEAVSFQIGILYPDVVNLRILIDDRSDSNDSIDLAEYLDESLESYGLPDYFPGFRPISSQVDTSSLAGHPSYSLSGTYTLPDSEDLGTVNETGTIIDERIYSIQYYGSASSELFPIVEHMNIT